MIAAACTRPEGGLNRVLKTLGIARSVWYARLKAEPRKPDSVISPDRSISAFGVDTTRQRIDSTAVRSAMRTMTRLGILVETVVKFLRELARLHPRLHAQIDPAIVGAPVLKRQCRD